MITDEMVRRALLVSFWPGQPIDPFYLRAYAANMRRILTAAFAGNLKVTSAAVTRAQAVWTYVDRSKDWEFRQQTDGPIRRLLLAALRKEPQPYRWMGRTYS